MAAGVGGLFVPVLWFEMDWQGAANKEAAALQSRQQYLGALALQKRCGQASVPRRRYQQALIALVRLTTVFAFRLTS